MAALQAQPIPHPLAPGELIDLARSRALPDRQRLLLGISALCEAAPPTPGDEAHALLGDVFMVLAQQAERDIRRALSECLARADWAPSALVNMLALDEIDIARPILAESPLLKDADLLRILVETTIEHQIEVARRPNISGRVADAVIDTGEPAALTALACNRTAELGESGLRRLVEQSRRVAALRAPLVRHPRMTTLMAEQLYGWVGQALRQAIHERFRVGGEDLNDAIETAVRDAYARKAAIAVPAAAPTDAERDEMDRRLIAKLDASGQLRPGYLIRAVREGRLSLFENALATLGGFSIAQVRRAVRAASPGPLALACASVGIDRAVYPALLEEIRKLSGGYPTGELKPGRLIERGPDAAAREFRAAMDSLLH